MIRGHVRDNLPRLTLALPGLNAPLNVEFQIDTGFEGELALPTSVIQRLQAFYAMDELVRMADGTQSRRPVYEVVLDWEDEPRITNILALEGGVPLLGVDLLVGQLVTLEMMDGGEVTVELL